MLIPYHTDAPIYHFPWASIGLIVANVVAFGLSAGGLTLSDPGDDLRWLMLEFDSIHPLQWVTHCFLHADVMHLVGNMFFLWGFGLVVEGKLGWQRFLLLYLCIMLLDGCLVQTLMVLFADSDGCALGASGVIFALMGCAVVWAPKNDMHCILPLGMFTRLIDVSILTFGLIYLGMQCVFFALQGFRMSSEALHLSGLAVGIAAAVFMLRREWVDCEGWDAFSLYLDSDAKRKSKQTRKRDRRAGEQVSAAKVERHDALQQMDRLMENALATANDKVIGALYEKHERDLAEGVRLSNPNAVKLISALHRAEKWELSYPVMVALLKRNPPDKTTSMRLRLAQLLLTKSDRPKQALMVLKKLASNLTEEQFKLRNAIAAKAKQTLKAGVFEIEVWDW